MNKSIGSSNERMIMTYENSNEKGMIKCYDGKKETEVTMNYFLTQKIRPMYADYVFVKQSELKRSDDIVQAYDRFNNLWLKLKLATNGLVNLKKTGSARNTCLKLFFDQMNGVKHPAYCGRNTVNVQEQILSDEAQGIRQTVTESMTWSETYEGKTYKYDVNSFYASLLSSPYLIVPLGRPDMKKITQKEFANMKFYSIGLYNVSLEYTDKKQRKLFQLNDKNWYTHYELTYARELGLKGTIIDSDINFMHYQRSKCKVGSEIFTKYVSIVDRLKSHPDKDISGYGKRLLASLWGSLYERKKHKITFKKGTHGNIGEEFEVIDEFPCKNGDYQVICFNPNDPFVSNWARIAPFLIGKGKVEIAKRYAPYVDSIVRCHTDGFTSTKDLPIKLGSNIGQIKLESVDEHMILQDNMRTINMKTVWDDPREFEKFMSYQRRLVRQEKEQIKQDMKKYNIKL